MRVLNKTYPTKRKKLQGHEGFKGYKGSLKQDSRITLPKSLQVDAYFQCFSGVLSLSIVSSLHLIYLNHFINHLISFHTISRTQSNHVPLINYDATQ
jgi:hypothetical protein